MATSNQNATVRDQSGVLLRVLLDCFAGEREAVIASKTRRLFIEGWGLTRFHQDLSHFENLSWLHPGRSRVQGDRGFGVIRDDYSDSDIGSDLPRGKERLRTPGGVSRGGNQTLLVSASSRMIVSLSRLCSPCIHISHPVFPFRRIVRCRTCRVLDREMIKERNAIPVSCRKSCGLPWSFCPQGADMGLWMAACGGTGGAKTRHSVYDCQRAERAIEPNVSNPQSPRHEIPLR